jgi:hypothetical protein
MEHVRREVFLGSSFSAAAFERAFTQFRELYHVRPTRVSCAPDVLEHYCELFERSADAAHAHATQILYDGIPLAAAILPGGTVAFEGEVDEERMGDW